jgi:hypothetical protein
MDDCIDDRFPVKRFGGQLPGFVLLLGLFTLGLQERSLAQAGSTGGIIGKQDKSMSGGEEADRPRAEPHPKRPAKVRETSSGRSCGSIVGRWSWYLGISESGGFCEVALTRGRGRRL